MTIVIQKEHALETYKSLITVSIEGIKILLLLNGGALISLLAYIGNLYGKGNAAPKLHWPMGCFVAGLACCAFTILASYLTQLRLYNESMGRIPSGSHRFWMKTGLIIAVISILFFTVGSCIAVIILNQ